MIEQMFMPLDRHVDDGFGAVGTAFKEAAERLCETAKEPGKGLGLNDHLPINYLYRHAIELFLKSIIVLSHRRLGLTNTNGKHEPIPNVPTTAKHSKPIYNVHGIKFLFDEMKRIFVAHRDDITKYARTDWSAIPEELEGWISTIDAADPGSAVFRYPVSQSPETDKAKSSFKSIGVSELANRANSDGPKQVALLMLDNEDNIVESFALDKDPLPGLQEALIGAANILSDAQFGVMAELGRGLSTQVRPGY